SYSLCYHSLFFFNDTPTTEIYTLSLHDALPICRDRIDTIASGRAGRPCPLNQFCAELGDRIVAAVDQGSGPVHPFALPLFLPARSEEHTSELQSRSDLVCRLLLEKKKTNIMYYC